MQTTSKKEASLYIHVPFCHKKCPYCHFYVVSAVKHSHDQYTQSIIKEWLLVEPLFKDRRIVSIYFGGGTPSVLDPYYYAQILEVISRSHPEIKDAEITLEGNPDRLNKERLLGYRKAGINRLSIGVQSLDDSQLQILGRTHSSSKVYSVLEDANTCGFDNVSCDLMYDLPDQTLSVWRSSIVSLVSQPITHISLYNLTFEQQTPFGRKQDALKKRCPSEDISEQMLQIAVSLFEERGFERYEISAFARNGAYSKHNLGYWWGREFMGLGPSAFSYWGQARFSNVSNIKQWHQQLSENKRPEGFYEKLEPIAACREMLSIALRTMWGVSRSTLEGYLVNDSKLLSDINGLIESNLLEWNKNHLLLTQKGQLFYDTVALEIIL